MPANYPGSLPALITTRVTGNVVPASDHNDTAAEVNAIGTELGTNPKGSAASVRARLESLAPKANLSVNAMDYMPVGWVSGTTVVTTEMQAAINAAAGNELYIPDGIYIVTSLAVPSNTTIRGAGAASVLRRLGNGAAGYENILVNSNQAAFGNNTDIAILKLYLDFSSNTSNHPYNNPIHMRLVDGLLVQDCLIRGGGSGCHVEGCSNTRVALNRCDSFTDKAISSSQFAGGPANPSVLIAHNTIRQTATTAHAAGSSPLLATQAGTVFAGNVVVNTDTTLGGFGIEFGDADDAAAIGNVFIGCGVLVGSGDRIRVIGNTFADGAVPGSARISVQVTGAAPNPTRTVVRGNTLNNTQTDQSAISVHTSAPFTKVIDNDVSGGGQIYVQGADCEVIGNVVDGAVHTGFTCNTGARMQIKDNTARNCGTDSVGNNTNKVGFILDSLPDPTITGNLAVSSNASPNEMRNGYYMNACTNVRWRENDSRGHTLDILTITGTPTWDNAQPFVSVASAAAVTLPGYTDRFNITGTTGITSITATGWAGRGVTLRFAGALTVTDGGNLLLAGNLTTAAQTTLSLFCDGTNWVEIARSVN